MSQNNEVQAQNVAPRETRIAEKLGKVGLVGGAALGVSSMSNAALEVTELVTEISGNGTSMQTVMMAVLTLVALFVGYKMIKRSMA